MRRLNALARRCTQGAPDYVHAGPAEASHAVGQLRRPRVGDAARDRGERAANAEKRAWRRTDASTVADGVTSRGRVTRGCARFSLLSDTWHAIVCCLIDAGAPALPAVGFNRRTGHPGPSRATRARAPAGALRRHRRLGAGEGGIHLRKSV
eukprot:6167328-Prymnesium_polylepis.2